MTSVAILHRDQIIARMRQGDRLADIARDLGYSSHASISMRLKDDEEYQAAKLDSLAQRMDDREAELEGAQDSVTIARARELLSHARWRAEREGAAIWGQKQEIMHTHDISDDLRAISERRKLASRQPIDITHTTSSSDASQDRTE